MEDMGANGVKPIMSKTTGFVNWIITTDCPTEGWNPSFQVEVGVSLDILDPRTPPYLGLGI